jgi:hypothetical protein
MSKKTQSVWGMSPGVSPEGEADYEYALLLHAEMNGNLPHTSTASPDPNTNSNRDTEDEVDYDADFALAMQMQFNDSAEAQAAENSIHGPISSLLRNTATKSTAQTPPRKARTRQPYTDSAIYGRDHPELVDGINFNSLASFMTYIRNRRCSKCNDLFL